MRGGNWLAKCAAVAALTAVSASPVLAVGHAPAKAMAPTPASALMCTCGGVIFNAACAAGKKAVCHCQPTGFKCVK